jgi:predicted HTH transcriptional regulator
MGKGLEALRQKGALPWPNPLDPDAFATVFNVALPSDSETKALELLGKMTTFKTDAEVAADFNVSKRQAKKWLQQLVEEGVMEKHTKPVKYGPKLQRSFLE